MEPLATTIEDSLFRYDQLRRHGMVALYSQTHKPSGVRRFEVVRIRVQRAHTWPNGDTSPEREAYPGSTRWGRDGWTFFSQDAAEAAMAAMEGVTDVHAP